MKRKADLPQINFRVDESTMDVLEAVVFVDRLRGMQELLLPVVEEVAAQHRKRPEIASVIVARQEADAKTAGKLKRLPKTRKVADS